MELLQLMSLVRYSLPQKAGTLVSLFSWLY